MLVFNNTKSSISQKLDTFTMKEEQIRIKIAEACGWTNCEYVPSLGLAKGHPPIGSGTYKNGMAQLPDYLGDLNSMRDARTMLNEMQKNTYARILKSLTWTSQLPDYGAIDASALDHAGAFLRTLNLWQNDAGTQNNP